MTDKEIDYRKSVLRSAARDRAKANGGDKLMEISPEMELEMQELSCRSMMSSIFCYHGISTLMDEQSYSFVHYLREYVNTLGRKRFDQVRNEQIETYKKCRIARNTYTDDEGVSYNTIIWNVA